MTVVISDELIAELILTAQRETFYEAGDEDSWVGEDGNYDDTYTYGLDDGYTQQARSILDALGIAWRRPT